MIDAFISAFGLAVAEVRHEILGGWFGRGFEPNPAIRQPGEHSREPEIEHDPLGRTRDLGIDR